MHTQIDFQALLSNSLSLFNITNKFKLTVLHYAHGIVSCRYTDTLSCESWFVALKLNEEVVIVRRLRLAPGTKLFVRNDAHCLCLGLHSVVEPYNCRRWSLWMCDIQLQRWSAAQLVLGGFEGADIGITVCFEIFDGALYAVSGQNTIGIDGLDWNSFYKCIRIPLDGEAFFTAPVQIMMDETWRRDHSDGPLDERWLRLGLQRNEATGKIQIIEARREWLTGKSSAQRTIYSTDLPPTLQPEAEPSPYRPETGRRTCFPGFTPSVSRCNERRGSREAHPADGPFSSMQTTNKTCLGRYFPEVATYVDLISQQNATEGVGHRQLYIRAGSRDMELPVEHLGNLEEDDKKALHSAGLVAGYPKEEAVSLWPPDPAVADRSSRTWSALMDPAAAEATSDSIIGHWDDRSVVYARDEGDAHRKAIGFVSFDPSIRLTGLPSWDPSLGTLEAARVTGKCMKVDHPTANRGVRDALAQPSQWDRVGDADRDSGLEGKSSGLPSWAKAEAAMYVALQSGYNFAL